MNVLIRAIILTVMLAAFGAPYALAIDPPHSAVNGIACNNCHYAGSTINSIGFYNFCNSCHKPGGMAQLHPFSPNDASNIFNNVTSKRTGVIQQHSHNWGGGVNVPRAGAVAPTSPSMNYTPLVGMSCARCHNIHGALQSAGNTWPFLRMLNDVDQMCLDCHSPRKTTDHTTGSHPVTRTYTTAIKRFARYTTLFYLTPVNANPANKTSAMNLNKGGLLLCSTCHGVHYSDSNSATFDNASSALLGRLATGDGFLLRTDMHGATANATNICTNCHKGKVAHNGKNQNIQCADCHAAHVDEGDGTKPNVWLVRRYMTYSTGTYKLDNRAAGKPTFFQSTTTKNYRAADGVSGVCQSCHVLPNTVAEHTQPQVDCNMCHYHNNPAGSFTAAGGSCTTCHGQPPTVDAAGGPSGSASTYFASTGIQESKTPHATHAGGSVYSFSCAQCHQGYSHNTSTFQDVFLSPAGTLSATGTTPTYNGTNRSCSATYCHSNGAPRGGTLVPVTVSWVNGKGTITGTGAAGCGACHGNASTLATNAHSKHLTMGYACESCHSLTATGSTAIKDVTKHVDGNKQISFLATGMTAGATFNTTTANCTNKCHSSNALGAAPVTAPTWTVATSGQCGSCHNATAPLINTSAHTAHFTATYGPAFAAAATSCANCHTYTSETAATHVNGTVEVKTCTPCHQGTAPTWASGRLSCESCHTGTLSVINGITAPDKTLSATKGHNQATFTGAPTCNTCHDPNSAHISNALGTYMRLPAGQANDNTQCATCHKVAGKTIAAYQNMSTHFTTKGGPQDMLCKACHDPHGTSNLKMIRTSLKGSWTNATSYTITYLDRVNGFVNTTNNRGLCQVCHTKTNHYRAGVPETGHPTTGCLDCHRHNAAGGAFKPKGTCDACHGYPPAPAGVSGLTFGTTGNYANAALENYTGGGGAHLIPAHVSPNATVAQAWANCTPCHNAGVGAHKTITPIKSNIGNVTVSIDQTLRFNAGIQAKYSGAKLVYPGNQTGTCNNVECHFKPSPRWSITR